MINDLIFPITSKLNQDREMVVTTNLRNSLIEERLSKLEYVLSLTESKPKIFEDISDSLSSIRADLRETEQ